MNATLLKPIIALLPAGILFVGALVLFLRTKVVWSLVQLLGCGFLVIVVLTHLAETFDLFSFVGWGSENSLGHYLDFGSAILGLTLFPIGYFLFALRTQRT